MKLYRVTDINEASIWLSGQIPLKTQKCLSLYRSTTFQDSKNKESDTFFFSDIQDAVRFYCYRTIFGRCANIFEFEINKNDLEHTDLGVGNYDNVNLDLDRFDMFDKICYNDIPVIELLLEQDKFTASKYNLVTEKRIKQETKELVKLCGLPKYKTALESGFATRGVDIIQAKSFIKAITGKLYQSQIGEVIHEII